MISFMNVLLNPLNAELNPICHLLALLRGATIVDVGRLRVNGNIEPSASVLEHAYDMLLALPMQALPFLLSAGPSRLPVVPAVEPYIVARFLPCPSIILSAKVTEEQFTLL
jgi:hypothetical protein